MLFGLWIRGWDVRASGGSCVEYVERVRGATFSMHLPFDREQATFALPSPSRWELTPDWIRRKHRLIEGRVAKFFGNRDRTSLDELWDESLRLLQACLELGETLEAIVRSLPCAWPVRDQRLLRREFPHGFEAASAEQRTLLASALKTDAAHAVATLSA